jgi:hypothetical protein
MPFYLAVAFTAKFLLHLLRFFIIFSSTLAPFLSVAASKITRVKMARNSQTSRRSRCDPLRRQLQPTPTIQPISYLIITQRREEKSRGKSIYRFLSLKTAPSERERSGKNVVVCARRHVWRWQWVEEDR